MVRTSEKLGCIVIAWGLALGWADEARSQNAGHGVHAHAVDARWLLHCELKTPTAPAHLTAPLNIKGSRQPADLAQTISVHPDLGPLQVTRYLPSAVLRQSVVPRPPGTGDAAVHLSIEGPTQSFQRWLIADDWRRNRLTSFIATWRFQTIANADQHAELLAQFRNELTRDPVVTISHPDGRKLGRLAAKPGSVQALKAPQATFRIREFYPHFAMDDQSGQPVNVSSELVNPAALVEVESAGTIDARWVFAKFPEFESADAATRPFQLALDCPLVKKTNVPDYALLSDSSGRLELWTRHDDTVEVQPLSPRQTMAIRGSQYVFQISDFVACGKLEEHFEPADQRHGKPALRVEFPGAGGVREHKWLQPGKARVVDTPLGALTLTFANANAGAGGAGGPPVIAGTRAAQERTVAVAMAILLGGTMTAGGQTAPPDYGRDCSSSGCHDGFARRTVVHHPVGDGDCAACHQASAAGPHTFDLTVDAAELCLECHDEEDYEGTTVHAPLALGECTACHDPHGASQPALLRTALGELCVECHEELTEDFDHLHGPLAAGACTACHDAHASDHPSLLTADSRALCLGCHQDFKKSILQLPHQHQPLADDCGGCHDPHGGADRMNLRMPHAELCYDCHDELADAVAEAEFGHAPLQAEAGCTACHDPHASAVKHLLTRPAGELCLSCHGPGRASAPEKGSSLAWLSKPGAHVHGPIAGGDCVSCHQPHGGTRARLLSGSFPKRFYAGFTEDAYGLCFECHDVEAFEEASTRELTGFRDGDRNLHFLHVNRAAKGRSCRACHETHAASNDKLIAESVPFGDWRIPLNFRATADGGSCLPGCHKPYRYDRAKGLEAPPPASTGPQHSQMQE